MMTLHDWLAYEDEKEAFRDAVEVRYRKPDYNDVYREMHKASQGRNQSSTKIS